jgi:hypothetical protein
MFNIAITELSIARLTTTPFRWGLGFQPLVPLMSHYPLRPHRKNLPMFNQRSTKPPSLLNGFSTSTNRSMIFCRNPMLSTSSAMINIGCHTSFRWETRFGCICRRSLTGPHWKLRPLRYGPYTITKVVGDNDFELSIPPFLGLHPVFNVDLLWPYFPPLLDTSEIVEQLKPTELNLDCMEHETIDQIMDTQVKGTRQQRIQLYWVVKAGQLLHQGKWLTRAKFSRSFPI